MRMKSELKDDLFSGTRVRGVSCHFFVVGLFPVLKHNVLSLCFQTHMFVSLEDILVQESVFLLGQLVGDTLFV